MRTKVELTLEGAQVLGPDGFGPGPLALSGGRIAAAPAGRRVALPGFLVLPGIVDIHGDGFERHVAPRRGVLTDLAVGLEAAEAEIAASGITTAVLAQFFSWEGGLRGPEFAARFLEALGRYHSRGTDLRAQLRLEMHLLDGYAEAEALIAAHGVGYVVFNDHLPHEALAKGKRPPRLTGQALKAGRNPDRHYALMQELFARRGEVPGAARALAARLAARGVVLGSHDDRDAETRAFWQGCGARIAEFPETEVAARAAREMGSGIVMGAPNAMRGNSHKGNVGAEALVQAGLCDALASDYLYIAPLHAVWKLAGGEPAALARLWPLVSDGPARLLGLSDRGTLAPGQRADVVIVDAATGRLGATIADGQVTYASGAVAAALMAL